MKSHPHIRVLLLMLCLSGAVLWLNGAEIHAGPVPDQYASPVRKISQWLNEKISAGKYVGVSIGFVDGDYMWTDGFGLADIERQVPMSSESVHRLASITKSMTAVGIILLAQEGKINLDAEVQTYVPNFPKKKWPITVRRLLGHQAGVSHYRNFLEESDHTKRFTTQEALAIFQDWDLKFKPGSRYSYTSYGYNLLGAVIEGASGQSYGEYMTEHVWQPLGMSSTRLDDLRDIIPNRVAGYVDDDGGFINCRPVTTSMKYAAGGTVSTVGDLLRYAKGLMDGKLIDKRWQDSMWTPMTTDSGYLAPYGMGWRIADDSRHFEVYHGGRQDGTRTFLWMAPGRKLAIAVLCNYDNADRWTPVRILIKEILKRPFVLPQVYSSRPENAHRVTYLSASVNAGCAYYDRYRRALTTDVDRVSAGFNYLNEALALTEREEIEDRIDKGLWPITDRTVLCATSFMANVLSERHGTDYLWRYHRAGILQICSDYIELYRRDENFGQNFRFSPLIEELVENALGDWLATWTPEVEKLDLANMDITPATEELLRKTFHGRDICPDLGWPLVRRAREEFFAGAEDNALRFAALAVDMYPQSRHPTAELGILKLASGDIEGGNKLILSAFRNLSGGLNQGDLNGTAYQFAGEGQPEVGKEILSVAIELFPEDANLYDSKADMCLMMGDTLSAIALFKKALEIDPSSQGSRNKLEKLKAAK